MDNLTHSIAGMLIAEAALHIATRKGPRSQQGDSTPNDDRGAGSGARSQDPQSPQSSNVPRALVYAASISANNLPDLDFVVTPLTEGKLGYLLHHRGHTHTVFVALGMALLQAGVASVWLRHRRHPEWARTGRIVAAVSCIGVLVHLLLDFGNSYGVHPFWPMSGRWVYGDAVFIIEPWWWSFGGATLFALAQSRVAKGTMAVIWALGTGLTWVLPLPIEAGVYGSFLGALALASTRKRWTRGKRLTVTASALAVLYAGQLIARSRATAEVSEQLAVESSLQVFDLVRTPLPSAPWCWDFLIVALESQGLQPVYVLRMGRATALPGVSAQRCPRMREATTASLGEVTFPAGSERVHWDGEYRLSGSAFLEFARLCWGAAFSKFARAPFVTDERLAGDLRYDRSPDLDFAEMALPDSSAPCPNWVPGWESPRQDVLDALGRTRP